MAGKPRPKQAGPSRVGKATKVVGGFMENVGESPPPSDIHAELEDLARFIQAAKAEIALLRPDEVRDEFIPTASDELDAIVEATAEATHAIMDSAETIDGIGGELGGDARQGLLNATAVIYEACGFQDITGQRITKVVNTLNHIEEKIDALIAAFGGVGAKKKKKRTTEKSPEKPLTDEDLLEGPQLRGVGKSQAEVDALLAEFD